LPDPYPFYAVTGFDDLLVYNPGDRRAGCPGALHGPGPWSAARWPARRAGRGRGKLGGRTVHSPARGKKSARGTCAG